MWHEERLLIDGELVEAEGGRTFETINPARDEVLGTAADATVGDARRAIDAARRAFDTNVGNWTTDPAFRAECIRQYHAALDKHREELRELLIAEVGAPLSVTQGPMLDSPMEIAPWCADLIDSYKFSEDLGLGEFKGMMSRRWIEREPAGVVAAIVPYNYPLQITLAKLIPALAAGCTVIVKGPPEAPWVTDSLGAAVLETDIPPGVVNVLSSSEVAVGELLVTDPGVDLISFTGSTATGKRIMAAASETVKKCFLELGGKSAFIVLDDADLQMVAMMAGGSICSHSGQGCAIPTRLLLPESRFDEAIQLVAGVMAGMPVGDPSDPTNQMGPLITARQREKVDGYVQRAVADGATVVTGGKKPDMPGYFYEPTLITGVGNDSEIAQEEIFGPVLVAMPYRDDEEAIRMANDSRFGLSGVVFGGDQERAIGIARRIRTGTVSVNGGVYYGADAPFGGYKQSGIGREQGVAGFEEYLEIKTLATPAG